MSSIVQSILDQAAALDAQRSTQQSIWEDLARICFPRSKGVISGKSIDVAQPDRGRIAENFDGTAMRACNTLATGQAARITPMGARWFILRPPARLQGNRAAENWFAKCTEIMGSKLAASNFYNRAFECYQNRGAFGISALECTSGANGRGLHFRSLPINSFSIAENSLDEVDTIFRSYMRTPSQLAEQFGLENLPKEIQKKFDDAAARHKSSETILHAVFPRRNRDPRKMDAKNKPFASFHIHKESSSLLLESGFDSNPLAVSRWQTNPLSPYGWAPADYALPEAAQANFQEQMLDVLAETAAFPRVLYPAGMKDEIAFEAMGLTSFDPAAGESAIPREWLTGGRYDIGKDRAQDKRSAIEDAFFVKLFSAVSQLSPNATATQVSAIVGESRELFHPIYSNMVREFHTPILRRCFSLLMIQGEMPPPPSAVIEGDDFGPFIADPDVEYVSVMAMALEQNQIAKFSDLIQIMAPLSQNDPAWLETLNPEVITPHFVRLQGLPADFNRTDEQIQALKDQQAAQAQAAQAAQATQAVKNLGGVDEAAKAAAMAQQARATP